MCIYMIHLHVLICDLFVLIVNCSKIVRACNLQHLKCICSILQQTLLSDVAMSRECLWFVPWLSPMLFTSGFTFKVNFSWYVYSDGGQIVDVGLELNLQQQIITYCIVDPSLQT